MGHMAAVGKDRLVCVHSFYVKTDLVDCTACIGGTAVTLSSVRVRTFLPRNFSSFKGCCYIIHLINLAK